MENRLAVYVAIDGERNYQDAKWGPTPSKGNHSVTEFLVYMRDYIEEALHSQSRETVTTADPKALDIVRKVTALGVACMEQNGVVPRQTLPLNYGGCGLGHCKTCNGQ